MALLLFVESKGIVLFSSVFKKECHPQALEKGQGLLP